MFTKTLVLLAYVSAAFAVPFITQPIATTSYAAGQPGTVKWQDNGSEPSLAKYGPCAISIYAGNALQQTRLQSLNASVDVSKVSEIQFTPDATIGPNSSEYFIRVESLSLKDPSQPQYPALAFSAKFTLTGMTGTFSADVEKQIKGQSTAPLASPTGSGATSAPASASATPSSGLVTSKKASASAAASTPSSTATKGAAIIGAQAGWASALFGALLGVTML